MKECGQTEATMGLDGTGWDGMRGDETRSTWIGLDWRRGQGPGSNA